MSEFDGWPQGTWVGENRRRLGAICVGDRWKLLEVLKDARDTFNANARLISRYVDYDKALTKDFQRRAEAVAQNDALIPLIEGLADAIDGVSCSFLWGGKSDTHSEYQECALYIGEEGDEARVP